MKQLIVFLLIVFLQTSIFSQTTITGHVKDKKNMPIAFANVYLKNSFEGMISDENGNFTFETKLIGNQSIIVSIIGYQSSEKKIVLKQGNLFEITIQLKEGTTLSEVVVSAGVFDASDEKKATILKPLDIVTNPGASGDIYGALATLPGITPIQDETGLFVRGGEASETKTIIDGALVSKPFFNETPSIPARGRFNPFLFKGTTFSTGGYSARFGQALSSVLILDTENIPKKDRLNVGINMAGVNASFVSLIKNKTNKTNKDTKQKARPTSRNTSAALLGNIGYSNLAPLFSIVPQNRTWIKAPIGINTSLGFRNYSENGNLFKSFLQFQKGNLELEFKGYNNQTNSIRFKNENQNLFWNNSFKGQLGSEWAFLAVGSFSYDKNTDNFNEQISEIEDYLTQSRLSVNRKIGSTTLRIGNETQLATKKYSETNKRLNNNYLAFFSEADFKINNKLALRLGLRSEYSSIIDKWNLMPRTSLSYRIANNAIFSLAYGQFYQTPDYENLLLTKHLNFEKSTHYIANYQWKRNNRIFRIEGYYKDYKDLLLYKDNINNNGYGFSKGIDVFWRDQQSVSNLTYWFSYSLLSSKRFYKDYPTSATPTFVSIHTLNLVANYNITPRARIGTSYTYASGRPFYNPNSSTFLTDNIQDFHNINFSSSYMVSLFGNFSVIYVSLKNPFQFKQVAGYRYSFDGKNRTPILPSNDWSFFAGISINLNSTKI